MGTLAEYLADKGRALAERLARIARGEAAPIRLAARVTAEGRSGVRRIRIREHQVLSDSPPDFAGFDLGPSSPELQLGVLGSCLTHIVLIQAAERGVPIDSVEVEVKAQIDPRGGRPGYEHVPLAPHDIETHVHIVSTAPREQVQALYDQVERTCPILSLLRNPQTVKGTLHHHDPLKVAGLESYAVNL
jgi:uncharacterized OsmC-like protein